jgi:tryptophan synthase alpha subunit
MRRGTGGRIEQAFATAKEKGEAAFVSFVTAGYPSADGKIVVQSIAIFGMENAIFISLV